MKPWAKQKGFTIVELLIVIVVIAILAAISIVAYNGIQQRGRDSVRTSGIRSLQKVIEIYKIDTGSYPQAINGGTPIADGSGSALSNLSTALVPGYIPSIPTDPKPGVTYSYVRQDALGRYAILINYETQTVCHSGMNNQGVGYWGYQACV